MALSGRSRFSGADAGRGRSHREPPAPDETSAPDDQGGDAAAGRRKPARPTLSLKGRALAYLARREYSRLELQRKLAPHAPSPETLAQVLDGLERDNFLSNARFAESVVHRRAGRLGAARIVSELKQHAVDADTVASVARRLRDSELARAREVWRKKFGASAKAPGAADIPDTPQSRAKQIRFLAGRGFSRDVIARIVGGTGSDADLNTLSDGDTND